MTDYFDTLAAAFVRGDPGSSGVLPERWNRPALEDLGAAECAALCDHARAAGVRIHAFKRAAELPRVRRVLGILRGLAPGSVLDLGSGRGVFLWPLLDAFPTTPVVAVERERGRVARLAAVRRGGLGQLSALQGDVTALGFRDASFDVVTLLEVLEHVPDYRRALAEALRVSRGTVVVSVPSKADDNPEHLHLFGRERLERELLEAGARRVSCDYVLNHLIAVARCP